MGVSTVKTVDFMQNILTKGLMIICKAALRELRESASFVSLKEGGKKILFYSCLIFPLQCFVGLCERYC